MEITTPIILVNNDGTPMDDCPTNPLIDKWRKLQPVRDDGIRCDSVLGKFEDGRPMMNYGCVLCHEKTCQHSDSFEVPEEDKEEYQAYLDELEAYHEKHGNLMLAGVTSE